jgi:hypothetical protein
MRSSAQIDGGVASRGYARAVPERQIPDGIFERSFRQLVNRKIVTSRIDRLENARNIGSDALLRQG